MLQSKRTAIVTGLVSGVGGALGGNVGAGIGALISAGLLSKGDMPEAPGNMRALESIDGGSPVTRHGMDQVIAGIEAQKKQDISTLTQYHWGK